MIQKTELQQQKANALKAMRAAIRLKHSLAADAEVNKRLPEVERRIDLALAAGAAFELTVGDVLDAA